jgi:hypothetical protein
MNQSQVAEAGGLSRRNVSDFLGLNAMKSLLGQGYTDMRFEREEIESESGSRGQSRFCPSLQKLPALAGCGKLTGGTKPPYTNFLKFCYRYSI